MTADPLDLGLQRIANPSDVLRIGIVATTGFRYSPLPRWERPHHDKYPEDTFLSYRTQFQNAIKSDDFIVLVQEDENSPRESDKTDATIPSDNGWEAPEPGAKVVVGVITVKLEPVSARRRQMKDPRGSYPQLPDNPGRDLNRQHYNSWGALVGAARKERMLDGDSIVAVVIAHPAYWKRGYGTCLAASAHMPQSLFASLGFQDLCSITAEGGEDDPGGVSTALMEFRPEASK
ncbi:hypothetical protein B0T14DRAFT_536924 [Immersiella caudata]|uniref:Uncharacterized protein n=1 Tax=Immersiella caudata TaxID=314043 RepID=A0AA39WNZ9_9PEZI|nr:hypothetical protein B0T14DRAFT_536924 [Immersiella caudata]